MSIKQKAVSTAASAALLASLLSATVAGTASAAVVMSPTSGPNTGGTVVSISGSSGLTVLGTAWLNCSGTNYAASVTSVSPDGTALTFVTPDVSPFTGLCETHVTTNGTTELVGLPGYFATASAPGPVTLTPNNGKDATVVTLSAPGQYIATSGVTLNVGGTGVTFIRNNSETATFSIPTGLCSLQATLPVTLAVTMTGIVGIPGFTCNSTAAKFTMVPTSGPTGTVVQLSSDAGTFDLGCVIHIGATLTAPTAVAADGSKLTFVIPSGMTAATYAVSTTGCITTNGGAGNFTVTSTAGGGAVTPASVSNAGGTVVQVTAPSGTVFTTATTVGLGATATLACYFPIGPTSVAAAGTSLTFVMPAENTVSSVAPGTGPCALVNHVVNVFTSDATTVAKGSVTYTTPAGPPTVTSVNPNTGSRLGGNTVTITGTGFVSGATVAFGSTAATGVTFVSSTQLTAVVPSGVGTVPVTVMNPDKQSGQLPNAYTYQETGYVCGAGTALGSTKTGPFGTATIVAKVGQYITWKISCGTAASGQIITVLRATKNSSGVWSSFTPYTSRIADSGGNIYVWYKASSPAWWSMRGQIASVLSPARQGRWQ